jgi:hypothetical protein
MGIASRYPQVLDFSEAAKVGEGVDNGVARHVEGILGSR